MPKIKADSKSGTERQIRVFDKQAEEYAKRRNRTDMKEWRQRLLADASGKVLELAVGAGSNFPYYRPGVELTAVDFSPRMLEKAKEAADELGFSPDWLLADVETADFPDRSFDTIVSTLSFCSYRDPAAMLAKINRWCKEDGMILLLEHGKSTWKTVAAVQSWVSPMSYRFIGCHQNRDMRKLLAESELHVQRLDNHFLNMVMLVWAKPGT